LKTRQLTRQGQRLAQTQQSVSKVNFLLTAAALWGVLLSPLLGIRVPSVVKLYTSYWGLLPMTVGLVLTGCVVRYLKRGVGTGIVFFAVLLLLSASAAVAWLFVLPYTRETLNWP
jgi:hypothetical protein